MKKISHGCTLDCADCCKFNVYVEDNKIIKIEGVKSILIQRDLYVRKVYLI